MIAVHYIQIITLSDLETDLMNVRQCCNKLNQVRIGYLALQGNRIETSIGKIRYFETVVF